MFIATDDGQIINTAHIVSAEIPRAGAAFSVTFADGRKERPCSRSPTSRSCAGPSFQPRLGS